VIESVDRLLAVDPGFAKENRLTLRVALPAPLYPNEQARAAFFSTLLDRLHALPGIRNAGLSTLAPFDVRNDTATFHVEGYEEAPGSKPLGSELRIITGEYPRSGFRFCLGAPLMAGIGPEVRSWCWWINGRPTRRRIRRPSSLSRPLCWPLLCSPVACPPAMPSVSSPRGHSDSRFPFDDPGPFDRPNHREVHSVARSSSRPQKLI
jgi:hypothetical protein